jgi:hypothetical protein
MLAALDWERYYGDDALLQFHKRGSLDTISLPKDFARFGSAHMYDIVLKNRDAFQASRCRHSPKQAVVGTPPWHSRCTSADGRSGKTP